MTDISGNQFFVPGSGSTFLILNKWSVVAWMLLGNTAQDGFGDATPLAVTFVGGDPTNMYPADPGSGFAFDVNIGIKRS